MHDPVSFIFEKKFKKMQCLNDRQPVTQPKTLTGRQLVFSSDNTNLTN